jgi:hypothetical protein
LLIIGDVREAAQISETCADHHRLGVVVYLYLFENEAQIIGG